MTQSIQGWQDIFFTWLHPHIALGLRELNLKLKWLPMHHPPYCPWYLVSCVLHHSKNITTLHVTAVHNMRFGVIVIRQLKLIFVSLNENRIVYRFVLQFYSLQWKCQLLVYNVVIAFNSQAVFFVFLLVSYINLVHSV